MLTSCIFRDWDALICGRR